MKNYFYEHQIKNYVAVFGDLFNNMKIVDIDQSNQSFEKMVPCSYTPKEKLHTILDPTNNIHAESSVEMNIPRMAIYINSIDIDLERMTNQYYRRSPIRKNCGECTDENSVAYAEFEPVPYNIDFGLSIFTRHMDHQTQLLDFEVVHPRRDP